MAENIEFSKETKDLIANAESITVSEEGILIKGTSGTHKIPFEEGVRLASQALGRKYEVGGIGGVANGLNWANEYLSKTQPREYDSRKTEDYYQKKN